MSDLDNPRTPDWFAAECILANFAPEILLDAAPKVAARDATWLAQYIAGFAAGRKDAHAWASDVAYALGFPALSGKIARGEPVDVATPSTAPTPAPAPAAPVFDLPADITITCETYTDTYQGKTRTQEVFVVRAPYNQDFNNQTVPGRWFDKSIKAWRVPVWSIDSLHGALRAAYKSLTAKMPDGRTFTL
jgi:hypothetical protein